MGNSLQDKRKKYFCQRSFFDSIRFKKMDSIEITHFNRNYLLVN